MYGKVLNDTTTTVHRRVLSLVYTRATADKNGESKHVCR